MHKWTCRRTCCGYKTMMLLFRIRFILLLLWSTPVFCWWYVRLQPVRLPHPKLSLDLPSLISALWLPLPHLVCIGHLRVCQSISLAYSRHTPGRLECDTCRSKQINLDEQTQVHLVGSQQVLNKFPERRLKVLTPLVVRKWVLFVTSFWPFTIPSKGCHVTHAMKGGLPKDPQLWFSARWSYSRGQILAPGSCSFALFR